MDEMIHIRSDQMNGEGDINHEKKEDETLLKVDCNNNNINSNKIKELKKMINNEKDLLEICDIDKETLENIKKIRKFFSFQQLILKVKENENVPNKKETMNLFIGYICLKAKEKRLIEENEKLEEKLQKINVK